MTASTATQSHQVIYPSPADVKRTPNHVDYSNDGGPRLTYLWCDGLSGQSLYLGAEIGSDGRMYCIPGHAERVLVCDPSTDELQLVGPRIPGKFKWLRGIRRGDCIYGLPCHADEVLCINVPTEEVTTIPIDYESVYQDPIEAREQRAMEWKDHGGNTSPIDGCIYCIPQSAKHVLKLDPKTGETSLVGPALPGRYKWYGGVVGRQDKAIYGIPHNSSHVLRITPSAITLHGDFGNGGHKWHGAAAASNGDIIAVPANADCVLCIRPADPEPVLMQWGAPEVVRTGRHRTDSKYKYLGAMAGADGKIYCFPSGSEHILRIDATVGRVDEIGPNMFDNKMERLCQNKWQNGLTIGDEVFAIPLAAESVLRINSVTGNVNTWPLPEPHRGLAKWEGGIVAPNGCIYTVPNNHKAILKIEPHKGKSVDVDAFVSKRREKVHDDNLPYQSGIPTLRSSAHRVKFKPKSRKHDPRPTNRYGEETGTLWLPDEIRKECVFSYDTARYDMAGAVRSLLLKCDPAIVGSFLDDSERLEDFCVPAPSTWRSVNGGQCESAQKYLSDAVASDDEFLAIFDRLVEEVVVPYVKDRLVKVGAVDEESGSTEFYYQRPPTLRLQPGPAWAQVKPHNDAEYGHQNGELVRDRPYGCCCARQACPDASSAELLVTGDRSITQSSRPVVRDGVQER